MNSHAHSNGIVVCKDVCTAYIWIKMICQDGGRFEIILPENEGIKV